MYKSTDGGFSFPNDIGNTIHVDQHVLAFAPGNANTIYVGNDGGLFVSKAGAAFVSLNTGLVITQFYPGLALNGSVAMGGTQDNGTNFTTAAKDQSPLPGRSCSAATAVLRRSSPPPHPPSPTARPSGPQIPDIPVRANPPTSG